MRRLKCLLFAVVAAELGSLTRSSAQTNLAPPSVQLAVSNILSRLTNDEAKAAFKARLGAEFPKQAVLPLGVFCGWVTNGPAVFAGTRRGQTNYTTNPLWLELARQGYPIPTLSGVSYFTNTAFDHFVPNSLANLIWTNLIARTNGATTQVWSERSHPVAARPPLAKWNTRSLMWGMKGLTALSPGWQWEYPPGVPPMTALTRRHGYTRGHGVGGDGFGNPWPGIKVWFLTLDNKLVETTIARAVVRTMAGSGRDYSLVLFSSDLPPSIEPMRVVSEATWREKDPNRPNAPNLVFMTEQSGNVSAEIPGFTVPTLKGGDSGSPNMLPMPGELVFCGGRTTSGPSPEMQVDMDELCKQSGLDPAKYQLQWVDLRGFASP